MSTRADAAGDCREVELGGLVGPTHNYAGLSPGNLASEQHAGSISRPRAAALQGLDKMAALHALGIPQVVLPPQPRPAVDWLRRLGFTGKDAGVIECAAREAPRLLAAAWSASCMWTANAATVCPSADAEDGRVHLTPANLSGELHRSIEAPFTGAALRAALPDPALFSHHAPVPVPGDEGAANHTRLCRSHGEAGLQLFVYGEPAQGPRGSRLHPARQSERASRAVARLHGLAPEGTLFLQQSPKAIDAGVFHNDVIATGDRDLFFHHEDAFADGRRAVDEIRAGFTRVCGTALRSIEVPRAQIPLADAVATYLFNCQLVANPSGGTAWVGPEECREHPAVLALLEGLLADGTFAALHFVDLRESMRNGGGPACLRLRVALTGAEWAAVPAAMRFDDALHARLRECVEQHYRERLAPGDLADPALIEEARSALDAVTSLLGIGTVYDLQRP